ncbi:MAG: D-alanyl-D-alanine carboxypeptidase family protein [bacterium]
MIIQAIVNLIITTLIWNQALVPAGLLLDKDGDNNSNTNIIVPQRTLDNRSLGIKVTAPSAIVMDIKSGEILFEKDIHQPMPIASLTKLMSALVFLEGNPDFNQVFTIKAEDYRPGSTVAFYNGEEVTIRDLFYSALAGSANNAIVSLARSTGKSQEEFVNIMNRQAKILGLKNTAFVEPTGLDAGNVSTAYDVARLTAYALRDERIRQAVTTTDYSFRVINTGRRQQVRNTNRLLDSFLHITGGKTGFTDAADYCLASRVINDQGGEIMVAVLGSASEESRFQEVKGLAWWAFDNYKWE